MVKEDPVAIRRLTFFLFLIVCLPLVALQQEALKRSDVNKVMDQLFELHVEVKGMNSDLLRRSYATYLDQADPMRVYFTESEVESYTQTSTRQLKQAAARYRKGNYQDFEALNVMTQKGIQRARYWRPRMQEEVTEWVIEKREVAPFDRNTDYPKTTEELKGRQRQQLYLFAKRALRSTGREVSSPEDLTDVWALYNRRVKSLEEPYLSVDQTEHYFTLHVLKALAKSLDSHTAYFSPTEALSMRSQLEKGFTGIGVVLEDGLAGITVTKIISGGPAAKEGTLQTKDLIVAIDGYSIIGNSFEEVLTRLRGKRGTKVELDVKRGDEDLQLILTREQITMEDSRVDARYEFFGNGLIGSISLDSFYEGANGISSAKDIRQAIENFHKIGKLEGLVLDLRENLGGFLSQAIKVAGLFVTNGVIAMSKYSDGAEVYFRDLDGHAVYDGPLVVLTSKLSASAAEIVAQSLQDYGIAIVVGDERTYGKGSIQHQTITDADADAFFKVTVGRYYTVSGKSTQIEGVKADVVVPSYLYDEEIGEEHLEFPLQADRMNPAFRDNLSDIDPVMRRWFVKYYLPTLQQRNDHLVKFLPTLRKNSKYRLESSRNFQQFLEVMKTDTSIEFDEVAFKEELKESFGSNDLQLEEAINIVKDVIILQSAEKKILSLSKIQAEPTIANSAR